MLYGWMKHLIIYLILSGVIVNLTPGKKYVKYINFFTGLIVILIMAEPLSYVFHIGTLDFQGVLQGSIDGESYLSEEYLNMQNDYFDKSIKKNVKSEVQEFLDVKFEKEGKDSRIVVKDIIITMDQQSKMILACEVVIDENNMLDVYNAKMDQEDEDSRGDENIAQKNQEEVTEQIKNFISEVYNVEYEHIYVVRR